MIEQLECIVEQVRRLPERSLPLLFNAGLILELQEIKNIESIQLQLHRLEQVIISLRYEIGKQEKYVDNVKNLIYQPYICPVLAILKNLIDVAVRIKRYQFANVSTSSLLPCRYLFSEQESAEIIAYAKKFFSLSFSIFSAFVNEVKNDQRQCFSRLELEGILVDVLGKSKIKSANHEINAMYAHNLSSYLPALSDNDDILIKFLDDFVILFGALFAENDIGELKQELDRLELSDDKINKVYFSVIRLVDVIAAEGGPLNHCFLLINRMMINFRVEEFLNFYQAAFVSDIPIPDENAYSNIAQSGWIRFCIKPSYQLAVTMAASLQCVAKQQGFGVTMGLLYLYNRHFSQASPWQILVDLDDHLGRQDLVLLEEKKVLSGDGRGGSLIVLPVRSSSTFILMKTKWQHSFRCCFFSIPDIMNRSLKVENFNQNRDSNQIQSELVIVTQAKWSETVKIYLHSVGIIHRNVSVKTVQIEDQYTLGYWPTTHELFVCERLANGDISRKHIPLAQHPQDESVVQMMAQRRLLTERRTEVDAPRSRLGFG